MTNIDTAPIHSCWNEIGVWGKRNCPELEQYVHCRHCPVYMRAASRILDREIPADYEQVWTDSSAIGESRPAGDAVSLIVFRLGNEWLAFPTDSCAEVAEPGAVHSLPHRNDKVVLGIVNIRGELLVCVNLAGVLGIDETAAMQGTSRFIVYGVGAQRLVFPAAEVNGVCRIATTGIHSAPATVTKARSSFTKGVLSWNGYTVGVLDEYAVMDTINRRLS